MVPTLLYDRARRLANLATWTVALQCRRLRSIEPEDDQFVFRKWQDFQFLIVALSRLRRAAELAANVPIIKLDIKNAISQFDLALPQLRTLRNVAEHIDVYATGTGRNKSVSILSLETGIWDDDGFTWINHTIKYETALSSSNSLFEAIVRHCPTRSAATSREIGVRLHGNRDRNADDAV